MLYNKHFPRLFELFSRVGLSICRKAYRQQLEQRKTAISVERHVNGKMFLLTTRRYSFS